MCTDSVKTKADVHPGLFARTAARFAGINSTGVGMHEPYKLQLVVDMCGLPRVLLASFVSAVTRPFGVKGLFYKICGHGVAGIDGFYFRSSFDVYKEMALINPEHPQELCDALTAETGVPTVLMDANDIDQNQLGKAHDFPLTDDQIQDALRDNPFGQGDENLNINLSSICSCYPIVFKLIPCEAYAKKIWNRVDFEMCDER